MRITGQFTLALLLAGLPLVARADVLMLKDGQAITGKLQSADYSSIVFVANGQTRRFQLSEVNSITFTPEPAAAAAAPATATEPRPGLSRRPEGYSSPTTAPAPAPIRAAEMGRTAQPAPLNITLPAGSIITVRMIDPVDSETDEIGQTYRASLDEPLVAEGRTIAARGADVTAKLVSKAEAGKFAGRSELTLVLFDITVQGRKYEVTTSEVSQAGASRGKETATRVGVGTLLGATIGAIAGGGKGAAIGAATGAGAGGAIQVMTSGEQVRIPPETRLEFTTEQPLKL